MNIRFFLGFTYNYIARKNNMTDIRPVPNLLEGKFYLHNVPLLIFITTLCSTGNLEIKCLFCMLSLLLG